MKFPRHKGGFRPFEGLKALLETRSVALKKAAGTSPSKSAVDRTDPHKEQTIFEEAMADVVRLPRNIGTDPPSQKPPASVTAENMDAEILRQLEELISTGKGFVVADTDEYIEGTGYQINRAVAERLHRGEFSIQGHIDLHGLSVDNARDAFEDFIKQSIADGKRMVLVIHGRGLSSPAKPILKTNVFKWLTAGPWRKWVMAFASARLCDGGAGATYVLLRKRPATKRFKKGRR
ncbi:MAG: Smr/MutS family protein [Desulfobacterales bacterium]|jgi:DNA-nicking Smr family endonuclease